MTEGHGHSFFLRPYEDGILRGECACGEIRFEVAEWNKANAARAEELNKTLGVKGKPMEEPKPELIGRTKEEMDAIRKLRGKKCRTCQYSYDHDGQRWCSVENCPSSIPHRVRPAFRPNVEMLATPPRVKPSDPAQDKETGVFAEAPRERVQVTSFGLPPWNDSWTEATQIKWLDVLEHITIGSKEA